ncbi:MAG: AbrB/MazE/SpoVT family DNA-binding domain-containing protein [Eubacteriaceae bacterium]|nr:AbrB/MazE/SpoVT family DNA-binding domain-containing protein [Eubacteriaceae bacterium]
MKATGIVRRIDDLGRVVIPKEIRRTMRLREGEPLEIFIEKAGEVILRKYSPVADLSQYAANYAESFHQASDSICVICDRDAVVAASGPKKKDLEDKAISPKLDEIITSRKMMTFTDDSIIEIAQGDEPPKEGTQIIAPITVLGDSLGCVVVYCDDKQDAAQAKTMALTGASFLGRILE